MIVKREVTLYLPSEGVSPEVVAREVAEVDRETGFLVDDDEALSAAQFSLLTRSELEIVFDYARRSWLTFHYDLAETEARPRPAVLGMMYAVQSLLGAGCYSEEEGENG